MHSRSEPLLWLQGLAIGAIPLELLLIRLLLAGADPGPVPPVERLLIWGVGVVAPAVALWKRPADWGSLLVLRIPTASRSSDQQTLTARQGGLAAIAPLLFAITALLPLLWWLDESAGLIHEFSPLQEQSRLITLLLSAPVLALIVWQLQQLVQAVVLLTGNGNNDTPAEPWGVERLRKERTSLGLQLLQLTPLQWPAAKPAPQPKPEPEPTVESMVEPEASQVDDGGIQQPLGSEPFTADASLDEASEEYPEVEAAGVDVNASVEVAVNV
ncbi:MAG: low-complexity tail membrane protein, partial [Synechococcus sp. BS307-5m-G38]|nr:low-complexity tail membrane protein [Synechococcus sp. BS307-5m-G38]